MERQNRQAVGASALTPQALVIGAGPVGLYQAFQLGLLGLTCELVDALPQVGGQCIELYPDKPIYDIPGLPRCTGRELIERLTQQIAPFEFPVHLNQQVSEVQRASDETWQVRTTSGRVFHTSAVIIAAGVGAFVPRTLPLQGLAELQGVHQASDPVDSSHSTRHVVVAGGDGHIMATLAHWLQHPQASLTLLHRRDKLDLETHEQQHVADWIAAGRLNFVVGQPIAHHSEQGHLQALTIAPPEGEPFELPCQVLIQCLGLSPKLGPIAQWGLEMAKRQVQVNTLDFGTSLAGIYAVGDINHYPGKRKLIACGFHEATLAAYGAAQRCLGAPVALEYTTASAKLHRRLKV